MYYSESIVYTRPTETVHKRSMEIKALFRKEQLNSKPTPKQKHMCSTEPRPPLYGFHLRLLCLAVEKSNDENKIKTKYIGFPLSNLEIFFTYSFFCV